MPPGAGGGGQWLIRIDTTSWTILTSHWLSINVKVEMFTTTRATYTILVAHIGFLGLILNLQNWRLCLLTIRRWVGGLQYKLIRS